MRYLNSALLSEGSTDDRFLPRLLSRALEVLCAAELDVAVDVADVTVIRDRSSPPSVDRVLQIARDNANTFVIVFFHRDQGPRPERVEREWLGPLLSRWVQEYGQLVTVVPIRETEAWMLADGDALRASLGLTWSDERMGLPRNPALVESEADPKAVLERLGRELRRPIKNYFEQLGETVDIAQLRRVPAFNRWCNDTLDAIRAAGFPTKNRD